MAEKPKVTIFDGATGEITEREATQEEITQHSLSIQESEATLNELKAKELARESALAKLAALGLTEAEIAAL
jgi:hypothetical protein